MPKTLAMAEMSELSPSDFLRELHCHGVRRVSRVTYRKNRNSIWSLTQRGTVLNVHEIFRLAPPDILRAFAVITKQGGLSSRTAEAASQAISDWPVLNAAIAAARAEYDERRATASCDGVGSVTHCCATPEQRAYVRALYSHFNRTRFGGVLPEGIPVRLSRRMKSALGHMLPGEHKGRRYVVEVALNVDLLLVGNGAERVDTLLHEMAHAADYLLTGARGHGRSWREWAVTVGCTPEMTYARPVRRRKRRRDLVTRVPPLPHALRRHKA